MVWEMKNMKYRTLFGFRFVFMNWIEFKSVEWRKGDIFLFPSCSPSFVIAWRKDEEEKKDIVFMTIDYRQRLIHFKIPDRPWSLELVWVMLYGFGFWVSYSSKDLVEMGWQWADSLYEMSLTCFFLEQNVNLYSNELTVYSFWLLSLKNTQRHILLREFLNFMWRISFFFLWWEVRSKKKRKAQKRKRKK